MKGESMKHVLITVCAAAALICAALLIIVAMTSCIDPNNPFLELSKTKPRDIPEPPPPPPPPKEGEPEIPRIGEHPQGAVYIINVAAAALTVSAEVDDEGELSCQWYQSSVDFSEGGTAIEGEEDWQYTPPTDTLGVTYYYAVITNTLNEKTAEAASDTAMIEVINGNVTAVKIVEQPALLKYTHGDALDLDGLVIAATYDNGASEDIAFAAFAVRNIAAAPAHGETLVRVEHNGKTIAVTFGGVTAETEALTVNKAIPEITFPTAAPLVYLSPLADSALTGGSVEFGTFAWALGSTIPVVVQNGYDVFFTPFDTENYDYTGLTGWNDNTGRLVQRVAITVSPATISEATVRVIRPSLGAIPQPTAEGTGNNVFMFNGSVVWSSSDPAWDHSTYLVGQAYTATVALWANDNYVFSPQLSGQINANNAAVSGNTGKQVTLTYTFTIDGSRIVSGLSLVTPPSKLTYIDGEPLILDGLVVRLRYNDGFNDLAIPSEFNDKEVDIDFGSGTTLTWLGHNGYTLTVTSGIYSASAGTLIVNKRPGSAVTKPTVNSIGTNWITVNAPTLVTDTGQQIEYAISTIEYDVNVPENANNLSWGLDRTSYNLQSNTIHYVYARSRTNNVYSAGPMNVVAVPLYAFTVNVEQITDAGLNLTFTSGSVTTDTITLYRTHDSTATVTIGGNPTGYTFQWLYYYNGNLVPLGTGSSLTLNVTNTNYGWPGRHYITVIATINGVPSSKRFVVEIINE